MRNASIYLQETVSSVDRQRIPGAVLDVLKPHSVGDLAKRLSLITACGGI